MRLLCSIYIFVAFLLLSQNVYSTSLQPDTIRVLAIRVEFQEDNAATTTGNGLFDLSVESDPFQIDPPPHNRTYFRDHLLFLKNYFLKASHGKLVVEGNVFPLNPNQAYQLNQPMTTYNPNTTPELNNRGLANLFRDALQAADQDPDVHFGNYQSFVIFHAGVGKDIELGLDETPQDIPSLFITSDFLRNNLGESSVKVDEDFGIKNGMVLPETESQDGFELGLNGMLVSNFGSQLGWPDLFSPETRRPGIGKFGLMDVGLFNGDGLLPALPCAWTRLFAGWEEAHTIYYGAQDEFTLHHPLSDEGERVYRIPINENEYFLVENRFAGKLNLDSLRGVLSEGRNDFPTVKEVLLTYLDDEVRFSDSSGVLVDLKNPDIGLSGSGALIWHIDENVIRQGLADNRINANPEHRGVDLEEADGSQDIGQEYDFLSAGSGSENGWVLDMWYQGNSAPLFKNLFNSNSTPNSHSYYNRANSHISISDFSTPDSIMTFRVSLNTFQQNFPLRIDSGEYGKPVDLKVSDLNADGQEEIIVLSEEGKVLAVNSSGKSIQGTGSLEIVNVKGEPIGPPLLFDYPSGVGSAGKGLLILTKSGGVNLFLIRQNFSVDSLEQFRCDAGISTHPIGQLLPDASLRIFWGCENGLVYQMDLGPDVSYQVFNNVGEKVRFLHLDGEGNVITVTATGKVFRNSELITQGVVPDTPPVGDLAVTVTHSGKIVFPQELSLQQPEYENFLFDSPMISFPVEIYGEMEKRYFVAGDNRLYSFNYNFSTTENFPVKIYNQSENVNFTFSPLVNKFLDKNLDETFGIVSADPAGVINGYDFSGNRLLNFPLTTGDSLAVQPALLDIDGDGDVELAALTQKGTLYVWDLPGHFARAGWNQLFYDELNSNRIVDGSTISPPKFGSDLSATALLPAKKVYNWPNPNIENFTFIRYFVTETAEVSVKIFDLAGDLLEEFRMPAAANTDNEIRWNLNNVQSGVYLAQVKAKNSRTQEVKIIKIAVIK